MAIIYNFYAKDFIQETAQFGTPIVPLDEIPQSKEHHIVTGKLLLH